MLAEKLRLPLIDGLDLNSDDFPHTITSAIVYRMRIDSFNELPKEKRPPRDLWSKPYKLELFLDKVWGKDDKKETEFIEFDEDEIE